MNTTSEATAKPLPVMSKAQASSTVKKTKVKPAGSTRVKSPTRTTGQSKQQSVKDLLSYQDSNCPDLNRTTGYPVHPNRIWPD